MTVLHEQVACSIESIHAENLSPYIEELAYHYYHACNHMKALFYLYRAADRAQQKFENEKSLQLFDMILNILDDKEIETRISILEKKVDIYCTSENLRPSIDVCREIVVLSDSIEDIKSAMNAYYYMGYAQIAVEDATGIENLEKALELCTIADNKQMMAKILNLISYYYFTIKNYEKAMSYVLQGIETAEKGEGKIGIYDSLSACYNIASQILHAQGKFEEAIEYGLNLIQLRERMTAEAKDSTSLIAGIKAIKRNTVLGYGLLGVYHTSIGKFDRAFHYFEKGLTLTEEIGNMGLKVYILCKKGEALFQRKRFQEAKRIADQIIEHIQDICDPEVIFSARLLSAKVSYALGNKKSGKQDLIELLENSHDVYLKAEINYELWCMQKDAVYRKEALALHKNICSQTTDYLLKKRLEELEANRCPPIYTKPNPRRSNKHLHLPRNYIG